MTHQGSFSFPADFEVRDAVHSINVPVLLVAGTHDGTVTYDQVSDCELCAASEHH
jgi:pimeloyl-ACP methyl ester carboxylesterase